MVPDPTQRLNVLVVDPEVAPRETLVSLLDDDPRVAAVHAAGDAADGLRVLNTYHGLIDIAFLNVQMPGIDGMELARILGSMPAAPRIIFAAYSDRDAIAAYEVGAVDYILKPFVPQRVSASIDRIVHDRVGMAASRPGSGVDRIVFLCHSSDDKERVRALYAKLTGDGVSCWYDEANLLPGQEWEREIEAAIRGSNYVLACLSRAAVGRPGYLQREIRLALDVAQEKLDGATFLIPARLEECETPRQLSRWQKVDLFRPTGYVDLLKVIKP